MNSTLFQNHVRPFLVIKCSYMTNSTVIDVRIWIVVCTMFKYDCIISFEFLYSVQNRGSVKFSLENRYMWWNPNGSRINSSCMDIMHDLEVLLRRNICSFKICILFDLTLNWSVKFRGEVGLIWSILGSQVFEFLDFVNVTLYVSHILAFII